MHPRLSKYTRFINCSYKLITWFKIFSFVKPYFSTTRSPGALAPKPSIAITLPAVPKYLCHPSGEAISIATRFVTLDGITDSLYSSDCCSNAFQLGIETTRTDLPFFQDL